MFRFFLLSALIISALFVSLSFAGIPPLINYQGMLTTPAGSPVENGQYNLNFKIYGSEAGDDSLWWENHSSVQVTNGLFNVLLGSVNPIPGPVFDDSVTYLGIAVGSDLELSPRTRLTSVGYAYHAWAAEIAEAALFAPTGGGWTDDGVVVRLKTSSDSVGIGTTEPSARLDVRGTINQGAPGSGYIYDVNFYGYTTESRMFWDASKAALRAGREENNRWHDDSVGAFSFAAGDGTKASGNEATALGIRSAAEGLSSVAMGENARAIGRSSVAMGRLALASGDASMAMGRETTASGWTSTAIGYFSSAEGEVSTAMGYFAEADGDTSFAIGQNVTAEATNSIVLGKGESFFNPLVNNIANTFMVGFNSPTPTLFVDGSSVGIGTTSPAGMVHIENSGSGEESFLWIESSHPTNWHEAGIRIETPENRWHFRMDDDANKQIPAGALGLRSQNSGVETMTWSENGNVGIGTGVSSPTEKLDVNGTVRLRGISGGSGTDVVVDDNGVLYKKVAISSRRYKTNIKRIEVDPQKILKLQTVGFEWKDTGKEDVGLIAEDVEKAVPDLVIYNDKGNPEGVKYDKVTLYLLEVVKAQQEKIDFLERRMETMELSKR